MNDVEHTIGALLRAGATPSQSEVEDLSLVGRFVSAMVARLTHGVEAFTPPVLASTRAVESMVTDRETSPVLSAATADRWLETMGVGAAMLAPRLSRPPSPEAASMAGSNFGPDVNADLPIVRLVESLFSHRARTGGKAVRPTLQPPRSLFGPTAQPAGLTFSPSPSSDGGPTESLEPVILADGSRLSPGAVEALRVAGLTLSSAVLAPPADAGTASVHLDGLEVDARTPALASALRHASAWISSPAAPVSSRTAPAVGSPERMGLRVVEALAPRDAGDRLPATLTGAFDASAGDFLHVLSPQRMAPGTSAVPAAGTANVALDALVPPKPGILRPMTEGVFPSALEGAIHVVTPAQRAPSGQALPVTERSPMGPPIIRGEAITAEPASPARPGPETTRPLSSPTGAEVMAERLVSAREGSEAPSERFQPVVAEPPAGRDPGALDDGVWLALETRQPPQTLSPRAVEALPVGRAVPMVPAPRATTAQVARQAPQLTRVSPQDTAPPALVAQASAARRAADRPAVTAREIQQMAPFMARLAEEVRAEAPRELLPSLVRRLSRRHQDLIGSSQLRDLDPASAETLLAGASAGVGGLSPQLVETLASAGWAPQELELLQLTAPRQLGERTAANLREVQAAPRQRALVDTVARVLTATESLSPTEEAPSVGLESRVPLSLASTTDYFEGVAPTGVIEPSAPRLQDAIGELLALARTQTSETSVTGSTALSERLQPVIRRLEEAQRRISSRAPSMAPARESERTLVRTPPVKATYAQRVADAVSRVGLGPAGVERLTGRPAQGDSDGAGLSVGLGAALAPEVMLPGLAKPQGTRAMETPGSSRALVAPATTSPQRGAGPPPGRRREAPVGGYSRALLHGVARGHEAAGPVSERQRGIADFGRAWLSRIDGERTGLDLGIETSPRHFTEAFGVEPTEAPSTPLTDDVHLVAPGADGPTTEVRESTGSGTRTSSGRRPGAPRSSARTSPSLRHVDVGGRGGVRRDLDQMTARVRGAAVGGERSAMPLIAPAMEAVATHAMRSATTERAPGDRVRSDQVAGGAETQGEQQAGQQEATLSREAFEALAQQMADRVAREMKRDRERRGQWT